MTSEEKSKEIAKDSPFIIDKRAYDMQVASLMFYTMLLGRALDDTRNDFHRELKEFIRPRLQEIYKFLKENIDIDPIL